MELEDETKELVSFPGQLVIRQFFDEVAIDRQGAGVGGIELAEDVKKRALSTT